MAYRRVVKHQNMTTAERVTLYVYPTFALIVGINFVVTDPERLKESPVFRVVDAIPGVPIWSWGSAFLIASALLFAALVTGRWYWVALACLCSVVILWAVVLLGAALVSDASPSAWVWPATICALGWASIRALIQGPQP